MELAILDSSSYSDVSERATFHDDNDTVLVFNNAVGIDFFLLDFGLSQMIADLVVQ